MLFGLSLLALASRRAYEAGDPSGAPSLTPATTRALAALLGALAAAGIRVRVGSAGRSDAAQWRALDAGRSGTFQSKHRTGEAVDLYPIDPATGAPDLAGRNVELFRRMHAIAQKLGWRGLAFNADGSLRYLTNPRGGRFWDGGHLEWSGGAS